VKEDPALLRVAIVTFSGQKDLIREVLETIVGSKAASKIFLRTALRDWSVPLNYVPPKTGAATGNQPHIAWVFDDIFQESGQIIEAEQVLLIDDDVKNIQCALEGRHKAVAFPIMPLPGIHMKAPAMEASGVKVLHRCQLGNGAILCISRGSVVDFAAPGQSAIVNAANRGGLGGGGVDGAISAAGGPRLLAARKAWPQDKSGNRIPTGGCRSTGPDDFGSLKVSYVLHTAGPNYRMLEGGQKKSQDIEASLKTGDELLASSYRSCMLAAKAEGIELLAFSLISSGVFRGPRSLQDVLTLAVDTVAQEAYQCLREVHLVAFSREEVDTLLQIVTEPTLVPASLLRGVGGSEQIRGFMDDFEVSSLA
jgi:O-acetyl-ADP-ribose deacetylase (regulator of RNase III)